MKEKNGTIQNISIRNFISTGRGVAIDQDSYPGCKLISIPYQVLITGPQILTEFRGRYKLDHEIVYKRKLNGFRTASYDGTN